MNAKFANRINPKKHKLEEVLPLDTPYVVTLESSSTCNFKCKFCPPFYSDAGPNFKKKVMEKSMLKKIIDDLTEFPEPLKMMRPVGLGEALLNKNLPWAISYAKEKKVTEYMEIITNGSLLNPDLNRQLVEAGTDRICISIEGIDAAAYREMAGVNIDWDNFLANIKDLYEHRGQCEIYIKTVEPAVETEEKRQAFLDMFGNMADRIFIDHIIPYVSDYDEIYEDFDIEQTVGLHGTAYQNLRTCPLLFYNVYIYSTGHVGLCGADWKRKVILGDLSKESLKEIWNGENYLGFLLDMLRKGKDAVNEVCAKCVKPCYMAWGNIDQFRDILIPRYEERIAALTGKKGL